MKKLLLMIITLLNISNLSAFDKENTEQEQLFKILGKISTTNKLTIEEIDVLKTPESNLDLSEMPANIKNIIIQVKNSIKEAISKELYDKNYEELESILKILKIINYNRYISEAIIDGVIYINFATFKLGYINEPFDDKVIKLLLKYDLINCIIYYINDELERYKAWWWVLTTDKVPGRLKGFLSRIEKLKQTYTEYLQYKHQILDECKKYFLDIPGLSELVCSYNELTFEYYLEMAKKKK